MTRCNEADLRWALCVKNYNSYLSIIRSFWSCSASWAYCTTLNKCHRFLRSRYVEDTSIYFLLQRTCSTLQSLTSVWIHRHYDELRHRHHRVPDKCFQSWWGMLCRCVLHLIVVCRRSWWEFQIDGSNLVHPCSVGLPCNSVLSTYIHRLHSDSTQICHLLRQWCL